MTDSVEVQAEPTETEVPQTDTVNTQSLARAIDNGELGMW